MKIKISNSYIHACQITYFECYYAVILEVEKQTCYMITTPLIYYDQIHLYAKNLEQDKYKNMIEKKKDGISESVGYDVLVYYNNDITPVSDLLNKELQRVVIFDNFVCDKNQKQLIDYFIQGRHKNCSVKSSLC